METKVEYDELWPRAERYRVRRLSSGKINGKHVWITVESFSTAKEAEGFARGFVLGWAFATGGI